MTGWPPSLLQDDSRKLSDWFASRVDARWTVRQVCAEIARKRTMTDHIIKAAQEAGLYVGVNISGVMLVGAAKANGLLLHLTTDDLSNFYDIAYRQGMERAAEIADESLTWSLRGDEISDRILAEAHAQNLDMTQLSRTKSEGN